MTRQNVKIKNFVLFWILILLFLNGVISFAYAISTMGDTTILWALLAVNFIFFIGITQSTILFSTMMRITRSGWGKGLSRVGEMITLSSIPMAFITFIILYLAGFDHIFTRTSGHSARPFFWRNILSMTFFYGVSYLYFRTGSINEKRLPVSYDIDRRSHILASLVIIFYVVTHTNIAWDFGMALIPHWESTIFPPYFWVGNIFSGTAFLLISSVLFSSTAGTEEDVIRREDLNPMGKLLLGYTLLWIYMFWAQYLVIWYGDIPRLTEPLFRQMRGNYTLNFSIMMITAFVLPFMTLLQRWVRSSRKALLIVAVLICTGIYINRYLLILPLFSDGSKPAIATWTGVSITMAGLAVTLLSIIIFFKFAHHPFGGLSTPFSHTKLSL